MHELLKLILYRCEILQDIVGLFLALEILMIVASDYQKMKYLVT